MSGIYRPSVFTAKSSSPLERHNYKRQLAVSWLTYLHCTCFFIDRRVVLFKLNPEVTLFLQSKIRQHVDFACCWQAIAHVEIRHGYHFKSIKKLGAVSFVYSRTRIYGFVLTETSSDLFLIIRTDWLSFCKINALIPQGCIKLVKNDHKDIL